MAEMFAFVLMPFDAAFDDIYKLGIKETAEKLGIRAERVDEQIFHKENILERIYSQIDAADFIIADLTGRNPNVFYETGYAHAKGKLCMLLTSRADDIPFDLKHHRHLIYGDSIQNLRQTLEKDLDWLKSEITNRQSVLTVRLNKTWGLLEKNDWKASAKVDLIFDLNNDTTVPSPEIEAIYFEAGRGWNFAQDGQECAARQLEGDKNIISHFIRSPVRRLQAKSWAQIKITGEKILETIYGSKNKNEVVFKDKYRIAGRAKVRVLTTEGAFDFPLDLDIEVDEFPF
jgi:nucleoside 2-deoxyribosyltransferase